MKKTIEHFVRLESAIKERLSMHLAAFRAGREKNSFWLSLGLNPAKMGRLENKKELPSLFRLIAVCEQTNLSPNWLLLDRGPRLLREKIPAEELVERICDELLELMRKEKPRPKMEIIRAVKEYKDEAKAKAAGKTTHVSPGTVRSISGNPTRKVPGGMGKG